MLWTLCIAYESGRGRGASWAALPRRSVGTIIKPTWTLIVPMLRVGMQPVTLRVTFQSERAAC